jgi:hypothetical protein
MRRPSGLSLLEVLLVVAILSAMLLPLFQLFSLQRTQVASAGHQVLMNSFALQRLAEEESRMNVLRFTDKMGTVRRTVRPRGAAVSVEETMSVSAVADCTGLYAITVELGWTEVTAGSARRQIELTRLIVDRGLATRLEVGTRETATTTGGQPR